MTARSRFALDVAIFVGYLFATNTAATGILIHEWLSVGLALAILVHLVVQWDATLAVLTRFFRHVLSVSRLNLVVDAVLLVAFVLVMLSGFLVSEFVLPALGMSVPFGPTWRMIHSLSAALALPILGVHVGLHWRWFVRMLKGVTA